MRACIKHFHVRRRAEQLNASSPGEKHYEAQNEPAKFPEALHHKRFTSLRSVIGWTMVPVPEVDQQRIPRHSEFSVGHLRAQWCYSMILQLRIELFVLRLASPLRSVLISLCFTRKYISSFNRHARSFLPGQQTQSLLSVVLSQQLRLTGADFIFPRGIHAVEHLFRRPNEMRVSKLHNDGNHY